MLWPTVYRKPKADRVFFNLLAVLSSETHKNILSKNNPPRNKKGEEECQRMQRSFSWSVTQQDYLLIVNRVPDAVLKAGD